MSGRLSVCTPETKDVSSPVFWSFSSPTIRLVSSSVTMICTEVVPAVSVRFADDGFPALSCTSFSQAGHGAPPSTSTTAKCACLAGPMRRPGLCLYSQQVLTLQSISPSTYRESPNGIPRWRRETMLKVSFSFSPPLKRLTVFPPQCCWRTSTVLEQNRFTGPHLPK